MTWIVYILRCTDDTLYTGITNDMNARLAKHENGTGAKYTKGRGPFEIWHQEMYPSRSEASKREANIKTLSRAQKLNLPKGN